MDLTEAFTPGGGSSSGGVCGGSEDLEKTDFFDFVVSPQPPSSAQPPPPSLPPHCASIDGISDEENLLHQTTTCRTMDFLHDCQPNVEDHHDQRDLSFIKETNNNTLTALPPVSTITSSLSHHARNHNNCDNMQNDQISMEQSDCDYWSTVSDNKESACNILLEDLNKYCWSTHHTNSHQSLVGQSNDATLDIHHQVNDSVSRACSDNDRQNTDGAIYTLTVLNNETDSMDALDCCKSPAPAACSDSWSLRPNLDLDAILSLEPTTASEQQQQQDNDRIGMDASRNSPRFHAISANHPTTHYSTEDSGFVENKELCIGRTQSNGLGDNNNDWKLTDQNHLNEVAVSVAAVSAVTNADSAESLLRSALQGKLYTTGTSNPVLVSSSSQANSTMSLTASSTNTSNTLQIITDHHHHHPHQHHQPQQQQEQPEDEVINTCTDEDLILSQLDSATYRPGDYEKLKSIANEVVESYCSLEPVCNVSATTVMYTLDPSSGNLGTITLPADLGQVGTVTVVAASSLAAQQDMLQQAVTSRTDIVDPIQQQVTSNQITTARVVMSGSGSSSSTTKSGKKYCRRKNNSTSSPSGANNSAASSSTSLSTSNNNSSNNSSSSSSSANQQQSAASSGSPSSVQRKERSLHYCSICSKGFKDKYSVNVHIRTHTGEKPFACSLCGKSFRQKAHLAKHYQTHVAQKPNVANSNNNNNNNNNTGGNANNNINNNNSSSVDISTGQTQPQIVAGVTTTCNPASN